MIEQNEKVEEIIESLQTKNMILQNKVNVLYKLCDKLEGYINSHNLLDKQIEYKNQNGKQISKIKDFDNIIYLEIPSAVYIITNEDLESKGE